MMRAEVGVVTIAALVVSADCNDLRFDTMGTVGATLGPLRRLLVVDFVPLLLLLALLVLELPRGLDTCPRPDEDDDCLVRLRLLGLLLIFPMFANRCSRCLRVAGLTYSRMDLAER